jgi:hypothetical protein
MSGASMPHCEICGEPEYACLCDVTCTVTPLQPPFEGDVMFFSFAEAGMKELAVSKSDGEKIRTLLGGEPEGRTIVLSAAPGEKIRIDVMQ